jgi:hypothetical protein
MKKTNLLVLGLALSGAVTLHAADNSLENHPLYRKLQGGAQAAPQPAAPAPSAAPARAQPAPAQPVTPVRMVKDDCGKKTHKNHGKGWAKGHDKSC